MMYYLLRASSGKCIMFVVPFETTLSALPLIKQRFMLVTLVEKTWTVSLQSLRK